MKLLLAGAFTLALTGCGGPDCQVSDREGLYLVSYSTVSGNCGGIPDALVRVDDPGSLGPNCAVTTQEWSADSCRYDVDVTCPNNDGTSTTLNGYSEQQDDDGDELRGKITVTQSNTASGAVICIGTYETTAKRQ